jgi:hypothetical protein
MSSKARRSDKSKRNRRILISAIAIFIILTSVLAYISSLRPQPVKPVQPIEDSSVYFMISDLAGTYTTNWSNATDQNPGPMILIKLFGFTFTPVNGSATDVRMFMGGMEDPTQHNWEGTTIPNGTATPTGDIQPQFALPSYRQSDGTYTIVIRIVAREADGNVTLRFTTEDLVRFS